MTRDYSTSDSSVDRNDGYINPFGLADIQTALPSAKIAIQVLSPLRRFATELLIKRDITVDR